MVLLCKTFRSCCKSYVSVGFFVLFSNVGHTTGRTILFPVLRPFRSYDRLFLACSAMLAIRPTASASVFLAAHLFYLTRWVVSSRVLRLLFPSTCAVFCVLLSLFSIIFIQDCVQSTYPFFVVSARHCRQYGVFFLVSSPLRSGSIFYFGA